MVDRTPIQPTIVITSMSEDLLKLCRYFIPPSVPVFVIDGSHGCCGMQAIKYAIEHAPCEWAILLDEDAFVLDFTRLRRLLTWAVRTRTACLGMCDGGIVRIRRYNPNALNPFFNILNLEQVRRKWNEAEGLSHMSTGHEMHELWPPLHILTPGVPYQFGDFESYYCFYFWLRAVGLKVDWLTGRTHVDGVSTLLNDRTGEPFLLHTWYARAFGHEPNNTARIIRAALWAATQCEPRRAPDARVGAMPGI